MWTLFTILAGCSGYGDCTPAGPLGEGETADGETNGTCAPEGEAYTDRFSCVGVAGPCRGEAQKGAVAHVDPDPAGEADPDLPWVLDQLQACSCSCCHNGEGESAHIWSWDFDPVWTDSIATDRLERMAGTEGTKDLVEPADNHGFTRQLSDIPSTDGQRLVDYLARQLDRR